MQGWGQWVVSPNGTLNLIPTLNFWDPLPPKKKQGEEEAEVWRKCASLVRGGMHWKSAVCNFCLLLTDCVSTAVTEIAVLKIELKV